MMLLLTGPGYSLIFHLQRSLQLTGQGNPASPGWTPTVSKGAYNAETAEVCCLLFNRTVHLLNCCCFLHLKHKVKEN